MVLEGRRIATKLQASLGYSPPKKPHFLGLLVTFLSCIIGSCIFKVLTYFQSSSLGRRLPLDSQNKG